VAHPPQVVQGRDVLARRRQKHAVYRCYGSHRLSCTRSVPDTSAHPTGWQTIVGIINVVLPPVFGVLVLWAWFYSPEKHKHRPRWVQRAVYIFVLLFSIFTALVIIDSMARPLPFWPFTTRPFTLHF
jgi:hypothetical protein